MEGHNLSFKHRKQFNWAKKREKFDRTLLRANLIEIKTWRLVIEKKRTNNYSLRSRSKIIKTEQKGQNMEKEDHIREPDILEYDYIYFPLQVHFKDCKFLV